ncbi:ornithine--oxo-acid transaminase [Serinibacter salmoneus]|uniref:ornithine aminotransferase n=1 Tax=Serinibacter salmoneus TaxID=556530 RepID=A0A2A9CWF8_9MICO|nr:ornithine--oxo-acid transaminase [Serinibacter salmoneus]PFG18764.1 ornithine--oxo-acid transaminase [Serinibacter salmoneus]
MSVTSTPTVTAAEQIAAIEAHAAHNYHPLEVVIERGEGVWVTDVDGERYLDCLAAYSAVNLGHGHPELLRVAHEQLDRLTLTSRAFHHDKMAAFVTELAALTRKDMVVPMNTGAEAVETAIKVARKHAHDVRGIAVPEIIVAAGNFHGRTTTIVSFSDDPVARDGFGPFTPGFVTVPFGDAEAIAAAITENTAAVMIEPIQGEAGVNVPPEGYLTRVREITADSGVLFIADEVQSGFARTGDTFAVDHEGVRPDLIVMGKALGGGIVPVSAVAGDVDVLGVLTPGTHGSTFGGNPLAAAVATAVVRLMATGEFQERSRTLGERLHAGLAALLGDGVTAIRGRGLWAGIDIDPALGTARDVAMKLKDRGILAKDTHVHTLRLAPPLVITAEQVDWLVEQLTLALADLRG